MVTVVEWATVFDFIIYCFLFVLEKVEFVPPVQILRGENKDLKSKEDICGCNWIYLDKQGVRA